MRYRCHECDRRFEDPDIITESHGFNDGIAEEHGVCPYCKGYFEEMHKCRICGEYFTDDELTNDVCDECIQSVDKFWIAEKQIEEQQKERNEHSV